MNDRGSFNWQRHAALGASLMFLLVAILRLPLKSQGHWPGDYVAFFGFAMTSILWFIIWWKR